METFFYKIKVYSSSCMLVTKLVSQFTYFDLLYSWLLQLAKVISVYQENNDRRSDRVWFSLKELSCLLSWNLLLF